MRGTTLADCLHSRHRISFQLTCPMRGTTVVSSVGMDRIWISTHVPHAGHDHGTGKNAVKVHIFQLTCPMRGTTFFYCYELNGRYISTHVPHAGHDARRSFHGNHGIHFNSRAPCGARPSAALLNHLANAFQLTCPMRGTTKRLPKCQKHSKISTHVPHAGHDFASCVFRALWRISTHVPHAGHDYSLSFITLKNQRFQLTCPMRGTTKFYGVYYDAWRISTHVPHAGHDFFSVIVRPFWIISTHVPHAGHDYHTYSGSDLL